MRGDAALGVGRAAIVILFLPASIWSHTGYKMGVPLYEMIVWDPNDVWGGIDARPRVGSAFFCGKVPARHTRFTVLQNRQHHALASRRPRLVQPLSALAVCGGRRFRARPDQHSRKVGESLQIGRRCTEIHL